jgi:magnesium-transporting ATPase (P-type)
MTKFLPFSLGLMFLGYFGLHTIYEWTHHDVMMNDPILVKKIAYLNTPFFFIRMVLFFVIWIGFSKLISYLMDRWDKTKYLEQDSRIAMYSAITLVVFSLTFAFASYDWIMSIEPHWFSTIFSIYTFSGLFVGGVAFITLALIVLRMQGYLTDYVTNDHLHDLGKWMFGMSTFWAYIWFCQYMLIWYSNIPEETEYYILRSQGNWTWLFWSNFAISFGVPFIFLMTRESKRNPVTLAIVAVVILIGRWVDLYTLVAPKVYEHNDIAAIIGPYEIVSAISYAAFFLLIFSYYLSKKKLIIENDPYFEEGLHLHQ